jgi:hypothetical protein
LTWLYLLNETDLLSGAEPKRMLHLAPEFDWWRRLARAQAIDFAGPREYGHPLAGFDPTALPLGEESFDIVCCGHALERAGDRERAIGELSRILRAGGWALVQVPTVPSSDAKDHNRLAGLDGVSEQRAEELARAGFEVTIDPYPLRIGAACTRRFGLPLHERVLFARKGAQIGQVRRLSLDSGDLPSSTSVPGALQIFRGRVECVRDGIVCGWAWQPEAPDHRVRLQVLVDGEVVARGTASKERHSLADAGIGDGRHAFEIRLPKRLARHSSHGLCVQPEGGVGLPPAASYQTVVARAADVWRDVSFAVEGFVVGRVEQIRAGAVCGWIWDSHGGDGVPVRVLLDGEDVGGCVAEIPRASLADGGEGDGRYGFRFPLPARLADAAVHSLRVEAHGVALAPAISFATVADHDNAGFAVESPEAREQTRSRAEEGSLLGSVESARDAVVGRVEQASGGIVSGWAYRPDAPAWRVWVKVTIDGIVACSGVADLERPGLAAAGIGDGRHGFRFSVPAGSPRAGRRRIRVEAEEVTLPVTASFGTDPRQSIWKESALFVDGSARASGEPSVLGHVEAVQDDVVSGWAYCPAAPEWRVSVNVLLDGRHIGGASANLERPQLAAAGIGDGFHGFQVALPTAQDESGSHTLRVEAASGVLLTPAPKLNDGRDQPLHMFEISPAHSR